MASTLKVDTISNLVGDASIDTSKLKFSANVTSDIQAQIDNAKTSGGVIGSFSNLKASATGLSATVLITADELVVSNSSNAYKTLRGISLSIAGTSVGANGLDAGSLAISTWYSLWVIYDGTNTAGLMSLSATAPTLPSGYTYKARVGWIRTDGTANKYPLSFIQYGCDVRYKISAGSNMTAFPVLSSGAQGAISTPTWVAVSVATSVPITAAKINICYTYGNGAAVGFILAPNNSYGAVTSLTAPPLMSGAGYSGDITETKYGDITLESSNIYYAAAAGNLLAVGWTDNL